MSDAPERIWVNAEYLTSPKRVVVFRNNVTASAAHSLPEETEYVRADLVLTDPRVEITAIEEVKAE
jgi:hypothetical protein